MIRPLSSDGVRAGAQTTACHSPGATSQTPGRKGQSVVGHCTDPQTGVQGLHPLRHEIVQGAVGEQ
jgi:hypothetical protein